MRKTVFLLLMVLAMLMLAAVSTAGVIDQCPNLDVMIGEPPADNWEMAFSDSPGAGFGWGLYDAVDVFRTPGVIVCEKYDEAFSVPTEWLCSREPLDFHVTLTPNCWPDVLDVEVESFDCFGLDIQLGLFESVPWDPVRREYFASYESGGVLYEVRVQRRILNAWVLLRGTNLDETGLSFAYLFKVPIVETGCQTSGMAVHVR